MATDFKPLLESCQRIAASVLNETKIQQDWIAANCAHGELLPEGYAVIVLGMGVLSEAFTAATQLGFCPDEPLFKTGLHTICAEKLAN